MKYFLTLIICLFLFGSSFADIQQAQTVHQYIVVEAYKLLKAQLGYDIPTLQAHIGTTEIGSNSFNPGWLVVIGAYREDEEDIVFYHKWPNKSSTHFWDPDRGDDSHFCNTINQCFENAYYKARKFIYGGYELRIPYPGNGIIEAYDAPPDLAEFYKDGKIYYKGYYEMSTGRFITRNRWSTLSQYYRDVLTWEILGRVAHLLADVGVPAHAHNDQHDPTLGGSDSYEEYMSTAYQNWNWQYALAQEVAWGNRINVINNSNPLKYLFYTTAQIANHFPSDDVPGNNVWDINDPFNLYPPLESIMNTLGTPPSFVYVNDIASKAYVYSIRATAALFHWFATEAGIMPSPPTPLAVSISGPTSIAIGHAGESTWNAAATGGNPPYHYQWWYKYPACQYKSNK